MAGTGTGMRVRRTLAGLLVGTAMLFAGGVAMAAPAKFEIAPQSIETALLAFGRQADLQVVLAPGIPRDLRSGKLSGTFEPADALRELLRDSNLQFQFTDAKSVVVRPARAGAAAPVVAPPRVARAEAPPEELVVTARKREERLIDVPMAVSNISGAQLDAANIRSSTDLAGRVPGLYFAQNNIAAQSGDFTYITMRGVGFNAGLEPAVGVYVDGVYQSSLGFNLDFLDADRIEVLRGPQGTLFGRNTEGGALNIVTRKPGPDFEGSALVEYGSENTSHARVAVRGPVSGTLFAGISAEVRNTDGYLTNQTLHTDQAPSRSYAVRPVVVWRPNDDFELNVTGDMYYRHYNEAGIGVPAGCNCYDTFGEYHPKDTQRVSGVMVSAKWNLRGATLTSITGARFAQTDIHLDNDGINSNLSQPFTNPFGETYAGTNWNLNSRQRTFSQELRLESDGDGPLKWMGGLYFFDEEHEQRRFAWYNDTQTFTAGNAALLKNAAINEDIMLKRRGGAAFGQASYKFDDFEFTAGLRYGREIVDISGFRRRYAPALALLQFNPTGTQNFNNFSPMGSISYALNEDTRLYATISRGWKAGGFPKFPSAPSALIPYASESSTNYEVGWKGSYFQNRASIRAAVYYIDIDNQQVTSLTKIDNINTSVINNAGSSRSRGFELETTLRPLDGLNIGGALSYADTKFVKYVDQNNFDHAGEKFPYTPEWTGNLNVTYRMPVSAVWDLMLRGDYRYIGATRVENVNKPASFLPVPSYDRFDVSAGLESKSWQFTFFVQNLFDSYDITNVAANGFSNVTTGPYFNRVLPPRTFGVRAAVQF
ncbi:MAG: fyuA 3 [Rhodospirillales bacterium]|nr:fyuA 3 [Rhodospirillales bacterium]